MIKNKEFNIKIATNPEEDLCLTRHTKVMQVRGLFFFNGSYNDFMQMMETRKYAIDSDKELILENYRQGLLISERTYDRHIECFKLISFAEDEDEYTADDDFMNQKIEDLNKAGIKYSYIKECVENFINASPTMRGLYERTSTMMGNQK